MATLATQTAPHGGLAFTLAAASGGGDACATGSGVFLVIKNGDSGSHSVTLATPETVDTLAVADRTVAVAAGATTIIPLLDIYKDPATGLCALTYTAVTSVTVGVVKVP